jgi:hypothetical protein
MMTLASGSVSGGVTCVSKIVAAVISDSCGGNHYHSVQRVIDQAHEQANAVIKGDVGAIGVTEDHLHYDDG